MPTLLFTVLPAGVAHLHDLLTCLAKFDENVALEATAQHVSMMFHFTCDAEVVSCASRASTSPRRLTLPSPWTPRSLPSTTSPLLRIWRTEAPKSGPVEFRIEWVYLCLCHQTYSHGL